MPICFGVSVSFGQFFSESLCINFALCCIAPSNGFNPLHDVVGFFCNIAFIFSLFGFIPYYVIFCPSQRVSSRKVSDFFSLAMVRLLGFVSFFPTTCLGFNFSTPLILILYPLATRVSDFSLFRLVFEISSVYPMSRRNVFWLYSIHSFFSRLLQSYINCLFLRIVSIDRAHFPDLFSISIIVSSVPVLFR